MVGTSTPEVASHVSNRHLDNPVMNLSYRNVGIRPHALVKYLASLIRATVTVLADEEIQKAA